MAEGFANFLHPEAISAYSAGISTGPIDPLAIKVMNEIGIDISSQETHFVTEFFEKDIDCIVTVCDTAAEKCPDFPKKVSVICNTFDDPPKLTNALSEEGEKLDVYRRVRDEIMQFVKDLPEKL